jgi:serine/threonine-protein kinase HipA
MTELATLLGDQRVGTLRRDRNGRVSFLYEEAWRQCRGAYPLSLSMPLTAAKHDHGTVDPFLWGLLPNDERVLDRWAKEFHVSARSAFALLTHVGMDCAGAVRFAELGRPGALAPDSEGEIEWLSIRDVAERLRNLRQDATAWRSPGDLGQFSLAGAQPKTALLFDGRRWGIPAGRIATTHILKPGSPGLDGHAENEHFCLALAGEVGLPVARSRVQRFDDEVAIVVERYDRTGKGTRVTRVHQEDVCQALAVHPSHKYENEGGPGVADVVSLLREASGEADEDIATFVDSLAFNWLVGGTDAHAKNFSLLIGAGGRARLAPLYDIASVLPYQGAALHKVKLAMKIGGKYRPREIGSHEWRKLAGTLRLDPDETVQRVRRIAEELPDLSSALVKRLRADGLGHELLDRLGETIRSRARACASVLV